MQKHRAVRNGRAQLQAAESVSTRAAALDREALDTLKQLEEFTRTTMGYKVSTSVVVRRALRVYSLWTAHKLFEAATSSEDPEKGLEALSKAIFAERKGILEAAKRLDLLS